MQTGTGGQFVFRMVEIQGKEKVMKMTSNVISLTLITPLLISQIVENVFKIAHGGYFEC